jgi:uncharacterized protein YxjI
VLSGADATVHGRIPGGIKESRREGRFVGADSSLRRPSGADLLPRINPIHAMVEIKVLCGCGTKFKFDVEPVQGRMPSVVNCPACGADGTSIANEYLRSLGLGAPAPAAPVQVVQAGPPPVPAATKPGLRLSGASGGAGEGGSAVEAAPTGRTTGPLPLLQRTIFFIRERTGILKLVDTYDILDPASGQAIGIAKEEPPTWAKWLRLVVNKQQLPTAVNIYEGEGLPPVLTISRGFTFFRAKIRITAGQESLGYLKSKLFSLGGGFNVFDNRDQQVAEVKGDWKGWNFRFLSKSGREIGTVTKKWAGLGRELFTSADNYVISITDLNSAGSAAASALLLAAGLSIDIVLKEGKG